MTKQGARVHTISCRVPWSVHGRQDACMSVLHSCSSIIHRLWEVGRRAPECVGLRSMEASSKFPVCHHDDDLCQCGVLTIAASQAGSSLPIFMSIMNRVLEECCLLLKHECSTMFRSSFRAYLCIETTFCKAGNFKLMLGA